jgi:hypothetical protein
VLAAAAGLAVLLALAVRAPAPPLHVAHGTRLVRLSSAAHLQAVSIALGDKRVVLRRHDATWDVDGHPADAGMTDAANELTDLLVRLRALDAFRASNAAAFGLDPPRGSITVETAGGTQRLQIGALNAGGSAFYAQRGSEHRVLKVGTLLLSALDRIFYVDKREGR